MSEIRIVEQGSPELFELIYEFRKVLSDLNQSNRPIQDDEIHDEMNSYFTENRVVLGGFEESRLIGFSVLKCDEGTYWLDWLYVAEDKRRSGWASKLFDESEAYAKLQGSHPLYIWVHPNNDGMLQFLSHKGYSSLNLIEVTKKDKVSAQTIQVMNQTYTY